MWINIGFGFVNFAPFRQPQVVSVVRPLSLRCLWWTIAFFTLLPLPLSGAMLFQYYKHFFAIMFSFSLSFFRILFCGLDRRIKISFHIRVCWKREWSLSGLEERGYRRGIKKRENYPVMVLNQELLLFVSAIVLKRTPGKFCCSWKI